ncbi:MAG: sulfatase-like hydrolase/transferase [Bryobacteraceae bacterium]|nr:sulfatase-like hydrolase/transferase [Bryobacteraceae bacterium]
MQSNTSLFGRLPNAVACACLFAAVVLCGCKRSATSSESTASARPLRPLNVLLVTIDTLRADRLRCYGYPEIETPNIDRIAQNGALFENAVAQTPLTPPSHASMFTGLYPTAHHVRGNGGFILKPSTTTLATILQQQGWDTAAFVSAAVLTRVAGLNQGFTVYDDRMPKSGPGLDVIADAERPAGQTVDHALRWLETQSGRPFFLWVHVFDPHLPYKPPAPFSHRYKDRPYDGEIAYADHELGRLFDAVSKKSPADRTLIAVLSDHGESLGDHGEYTHGVFVYDSTLRIPFIMSGPGIPAGLRVKRQARTVDLLPTVMELMGGRPPASIHGVSLTPFFAGKDAGTDISYAETLYPKINMGWAELRAIRTNRWKYILAPKQELYDLLEDPGETNNLIQSHAAEAQKLKAELRAIAGEGREKIETSTVDQRTLEQLRSLGYLSGVSQPTFELKGEGVDPKDRVGILKIIEEADGPRSQLPIARRIELLREALKQDPTNPTLYYSLGRNCEKAGRPAEAIGVYQTAIRNGFESGWLRSRIGDFLVRSGRKTEAISEYERAIRLDPSDTGTQTNLATAYVESGRLEDAERVFQGIIKIDETNAAAYNGLGVIAIQRRDGAAALRYFERTVQLNPDLLEAQLNLGILYKMAGDRARARASFESFLAKASPAQYGETIPQVREELKTLQ